jgi:hypothetical protein
LNADLFEDLQMQNLLNTVQSLFILAPSGRVKQAALRTARRMPARHGLSVQDKVMGYREIKGLVAVLLAVAGCGNNGTSTAGKGLTQDGHTWFPISSGVHAIGAATSDGAMVCASCHQPDAPSFKQFSCVGCHNHDQAATDLLHTGLKDYIYASPQCVSCHPSGAKVAFNHAGIVGNCAKCHDVGATNAALPVPGFTHPPMNGADCVGCHNTTNWKTAAGAPGTKSRDPKADVVVNALIPTYSSTTIMTVTPRAEQLPMSMDHGSSDVASAVLSACANCHPGTSTGSYYPGYLHASLVTLAKTDQTISEPKACASCHSDAVPAGFVGPTATNRAPASGAMKHDAVAWANGNPTTTAIVSTECGVCHASPSGAANDNWAMGKGGGTTTYHVPLVAAGLAPPSSCIDCHANSTPVGITNSTTPTGATTGASTGIAAGTMAQFNHIDGNVSGRDCNFCHTQNGPSTQAGVQGKEWAQAKFHVNFTSGANPLLLDKTTGRCSNCHLAEKPGSAYTALDHSAFTNASGSVDCSSCHNTTDWKTAAGAPGGKTRDPKADVVVNALIPTYAGTTITTMTPRAETLPMSMDHGSSDVAPAVLSVCASCHPGTSTGSYYPGYLHTSLATLAKTDRTITEPGSCASCHSDAVPVGFVGPTATNRSPASGAMKHDAVAWASGKPTTTTIVSTECGLCHASPSGGSNESWVTGKAGGTTAYHVPLVAAGLSPPTSCVDCHANSTPAGTTNATTPTSATTGASTGIAAGTMAQFNHADGNVSGRDCNFCHTQNGPSTQAGVQGKEWAQAKFHANFTSSANPLVLNKTTGRCSNCHLVEKPGSAYTAQDHSAFTNASGSDDCSSCHNFPGTGTAAAPNWLGAAGVPQFIVVGGFPISQPPATSATTQTGINNLPHPTVAAGTSCTSCHTTAAGGKQAIGYDHVSTLITTNCNACHEAGSNLVGTTWNGATSQASGAGDTRPYTIASLVPAFKNNSRALQQGYNHFFAVDCSECHLAPSGNGPVTTGSAYKSAWRFDHNQKRMQRSTCTMCHGSPNNLPGD